MAQLRQDYEQFAARDTAVIAVGPDSRKDFKQYWETEEIPFIGLADPDHKVAQRFEQEVNLLKLGRMPAQFILDQTGIARYAHYSESMADIPENELILNVIDSIQD